ncbi:DUF4175 domain-containing protein [Alphaproteobacteria bacterium]|nr:DUF4175 domain-containing protein [Alphaproteobacteria bacterium]
MVKEKLNIIKRFFFIYLIQFLLNLKLNGRCLFLILLYAQLVTISLLFGVWSFFGAVWHTFIILFYTVILIFVLNQLIKNIRYYNRKKTLLWIESKNFKITTPLTALEDSPAGIHYNKQIWHLHKSSIRENLKNINFILPNISLTKYDPLYMRYLLFLFIFLAFFWAYKNNKIYENIFGWTNYDAYINQNNYFDLKVWYKPPEYTKLKEKFIPIQKKNETIRVKQLVPVKSELKVFIKTNTKNFSVIEGGKNLELKNNEKNNYEFSLLLDNDKNVVINYANKEHIIFDLSVIKDKKPKIEILSAPVVINKSSLSFVSKTTDDYGIKKINLNINRPLAFKHFEEDYLSFNLYLNEVMQQNNKLVESYFYKHLADIIWAGSDTYIEIIASDFINQSTKFSDRIKIPKKDFNNRTATEILKIRERLAKNKMTKNAGKEDFTKLFNANQYLLNDNNIRIVYKETLNLFNDKEIIKFSLKNELFKSLYSLAKIIDEGYFYQAKKNLEQVEQSLFDSVKQNDTEKVSTNVKKLKEKIESLLDLENDQNSNNNFNNLNSENIKDEIEELAQQIEDLLKTGTKEGVDEKIQKLKQLSESIKSPNNNKELEDKQKQQQEFINKLSELLNEQEKVMEETFNRAAERGKFEQSSKGSGGKSPKEKQEELRNTLGNVIREIGASENEIPQDLGRADRAMRQASRDLEDGRPDEASNAQGRAVEMIQRSINKINSKEYISKLPEFADKGKENYNNKEKEYLADNQNIEYQGTSAGGTIELSSKKNIKNASKIAEELYNRFNEEDRSLKDKEYIKNLLDWY